IQPPLISKLFPYTTLFRSFLVTEIHQKSIEKDQNETPILNEISEVETVNEIENVDQSENQTEEIEPKNISQNNRESRKHFIFPRSEEHTSELQSRENLVCR